MLLGISTRFLTCVLGALLILIGTPEVSRASESYLNFKNYTSRYTCNLLLTSQQVLQNNHLSDHGRLAIKLYFRALKEWPSLPGDRAADKASQFDVSEYLFTVKEWKAALIKRKQDLDKYLGARVEINHVIQKLDTVISSNKLFYADWLLLSSDVARMMSGESSVAAAINFSENIREDLLDDDNKIMDVFPYSIMLPTSRTLSPNDFNELAGLPLAYRGVSLGDDAWYDGNRGDAVLFLKHDNGHAKILLNEHIRAFCDHLIGGSCHEIKMADQKYFEKFHMASIQHHLRYWDFHSAMSGLLPEERALMEWVYFYSDHEYFYDLSKAGHHVVDQILNRFYLNAPVKSALYDDFFKISVFLLRFQFGGDFYILDWPVRDPRINEDFILKSFEKMRKNAQLNQSRPFFSSQ